MMHDFRSLDVAPLDILINFCGSRQKTNVQYQDKGNKKTTAHWQPLRRIELLKTQHLSSNVLVYVKKKYDPSWYKQFHISKIILG